MRKQYFLLFVIFFSVILLAFNVKSKFYPSHQNIQKLPGKWQLILISSNKVTVEFKDFSQCHKRDYFEYLDSTRIEHTYEGYKSGCDKIVRTFKYKLTSDYDFHENKSYTAIKLGTNPVLLERIIMLNDSILKVSCDYNSILKTYKKIK